jgi:hypothetical protein
METHSRARIVVCNRRSTRQQAHGGTHTDGAKEHELTTTHALDGEDGNERRLKVSISIVNALETFLLVRATYQEVFRPVSTSSEVSQCILY